MNITTIQKLKQAMIEDKDTNLKISNDKINTINDKIAANGKTTQIKSLIMLQFLSRP